MLINLCSKFLHSFCCLQTPNMACTTTTQQAHAHNRNHITLLPSFTKHFTCAMPWCGCSPAANKRNKLKQAPQWTSKNQEINGNQIHEAPSPVCVAQQTRFILKNILDIIAFCIYVHVYVYIYTVDISLPYQAV